MALMVYQGHTHKLFQFLRLPSAMADACCRRSTASELPVPLPLTRRLICVYAGLLLLALFEN
jgi:nitrous oxide reductase accessory protein NosL